MNKQSLDERIEEYVDSHQYIDGDLRPVPYDEIYPDFKQIIKDVIQEVLPEKTSEDIISIAYTGKPDDAKDDWTPKESLSLSKGHNHAIDTINSNVEKLLDAN